MVLRVINMDTLDGEAPPLLFFQKAKSENPPQAYALMGLYFRVRELPGAAVRRKCWKSGDSRPVDRIQKHDDRAPITRWADSNNTTFAT